MQLTTVLREKGINPPGITPEGSAWLAKTLHPADNVPPWTGIPNGSGLPSVLMEYEGLLRINANAAAAGTYSGYINVLPHPLQPLSAVTTDSVGDLTWGLRNPTFYVAGDRPYVMTNKFNAVCGAYRMTHVSCTIELDAPALSNQGSLTAAQYPLQWSDYNASYTIAAGADAGKLECVQHIRHYDLATNAQDRESLAMKPFSYSGLAKDGAYMVLKMDPDVEWGRTRDCSYSSSAAAPQAAGVYPGVALPTSAGAVGTNECFPFYGGNYPAADRFIFCYVNTATATTQPQGDVFPKMMQPNFGRIAFWNVSKDAGLTIRMRWGVEMLVQPNSILSPSVRACAPRDDVALVAYSRIVDQLPDCFPASYNGWNELGDVLRSVWGKVAPVIRGLSHAPGMAGMIASGVSAVGDLLSQNASKKKRDKGENPPVVTPPPPPQTVVVQQRKAPKASPPPQKVVYVPVKTTRSGLRVKRPARR